MMKPTSQGGSGGTGGKTLVANGLPILSSCTSCPPCCHGPYSVTRCTLAQKCARAVARPAVQGNGPQMSQRDADSLGDGSPRFASSAQEHEGASGGYPCGPAT